MNQQPEHQDNLDDLNEQKAAGIWDSSNPNDDFTNNNISDDESAIYEWKFSDYEAIEQNGRDSHSRRSKGLIVLSLFLFLSLVAVIMMFGFYIAYNNRQDTGGLSTGRDGPGLILNDMPSLTGEDADDGKSTSLISSDVMPSVVGIVTYNLDESYDIVGQGSGVIMDVEGYIITNAHVLLDSDDSLVTTIKVVLQNEDEYEAELVGIDTKTDLAVISISAQNLVAVEFGNSDQVQVGDRVIAIGNPGGVDFMGSVSQGIISGLDRTIKTDSGYSMSLLQTDAAINPGNSGGPLVNRYGQVIGINSAKIKQSDYEGIGFSIPINTVKPVVDDLVEFGYVQDRVTMGITYQEIDSVLSKINGVPTGLYVLTVSQNLSAGQSGLRSGDIITSIDGQSIESADDLNVILDSKLPGDSLKLKIYRVMSSGSSTTLEINITLAQDKGTVQAVQTTSSGGFYRENKLFSPNGSFAA